MQAFPVLRSASHAAAKPACLYAPLALSLSPQQTTVQSINQPNTITHKHGWQVYKLFTEDQAKTGSKQSITAFFKPKAAAQKSSAASTGGS